MSSNSQRETVANDEKTLTDAVLEEMSVRMSDNLLSTSREAILDRVEQHELPDVLEELSREYDARIGQRDPFLWKWIHVVLPEVTLSTVPDEYAERAVDVKTATSMLVVLLDDLGERDQDLATLTEASKVPFDHRTPDLDAPSVDEDAVAVTQTIWSTIEELLDGPRTDEFAELFAFDLDRTVTAIEYSYLYNRNLEMANLQETWTYDAHNMMIFPYVDVDLMFSPPFELRDLRPLRKGVRHTQRMARIGNWVTTWEREIEEGDFTSGVVADSIERGLVSADELYALRENPSPDEVDRVVELIRDSGAEERFLEQWEIERDAARSLVDEFESIDFGDYLDGMEMLLEFHLASRGLK